MFRFLSFDQYLTAFLIGFSSMMFMHIMLEPTWGVSESRPRSRRMLFNYTIGVLGICCAFVYLHPELWFDLLLSAAGAGLGTLVSHARDWLLKLIQRDRAHGLIEKRQDQA